MAVYFLGLVPLARRIRLGLYRDGVWATAASCRWDDVARIAFVEDAGDRPAAAAAPGGASVKLPVPGDEYGTVRKLLEEKARAGAAPPRPGDPWLVSPSGG